MSAAYAIYPSVTGPILALSRESVTIGAETIRISPHHHDYLALCRGRGLPVRVLVRDGKAFNIARADEGWPR